MRSRGFWIRIGIALSILGLGHYYVWLRLVAAPALPSPWRALATALIVLMAPSLPFAVFAIRRLPRAAAAPLLWLVYTWLGLSGYLLLGAAASDLARVAFGLDARTAALGAVAAAAVVTLYGLGNVARGPVVRRVRVPLAKLPAAASGYTIAQLTDVHIGPLLGRAFCEAVVRQTNALAPDLIVITGDLVDGRLDELREHVAPLADLRARDGVYLVTGNHEYYWAPDGWLAHLGGLGLRILRNEHVTVRGAFELAGADDNTAGEDIARAVAGRDPALPLVLLAHHPSSITAAAAAGCDLQISGHTHGGQLLPIGWLVRLREPLRAGLARFGATWLYVSEGTGFWGPPMRVGTSCEIALLTLERA